MNKGGGIRSEGILLTESEDICDRWERYMAELFDFDTIGEPPNNETDIERPEFVFMPRNQGRHLYFKNALRRANQHQQTVYLCFIDYSKTFDKVRHEKLVETGNFRTLVQMARIFN